MDPELTFLRVHARLSVTLAKLLTPRVSRALEYVYLALALTLFAILVVMHINFVQQPGCSSELPRAEITGAQLVQIKITGSGLWSQNAAYLNVMDMQKEGISTENLVIPDGNADGFTFSATKFWSSWTSPGTRRKLVLKPWKNDKDVNEPQVDKVVGSDFKRSSDEAEFSADAEVPETTFPLSARESSKATNIHAISKWRMHLSSLWRNANQFAGSACQLWDAAGWNLLMDVRKVLQMLHWDQVKLLIVRWLEKKSKAFGPTYLYTTEKGYFLLPDGAKGRHNIRTVNISISAQHPCFGNRWQRLLISSFIGYDTILMNSLLSSPGPAVHRRRMRQQPHQQQWI